jgi:hypothetical protein
MLDHDAASTEAEERHKYELNWLKQYMIDKGLTPQLQKAVIQHREIQWKNSQGMDEEKLFQEIPKGLQQEIRNFLYLDLIRRVPLFKDEDEAFQNSLTMKMQTLVVLDGWNIFKKGANANELFFIKKGSVNVVSDEMVVLATIHTGNFFGESALFDGIFYAKTFLHFRKTITESCYCDRKRRN